MTNVGCLANALKNKFSIGIGDHVVIYMSRTPHTILAMLAVARLGASHCVVYNKAPAKALAAVLDELKECKLIITASANLSQHDDKITKFAPVIDEAVGLATKLTNKKIPRLIYQRLESFPKYFDTAVDEELYTDWKTMMEDPDIEEEDCVMVPANTELYEYFKSRSGGCTAKDHAGTCVGLNYTMKNVFNVDKDSKFWALCDLGWCLGHNFTCYGPLIRGCTLVLTEGNETYPDPGILW